MIRPLVFGAALLPLIGAAGPAVSASGVLVWEFYAGEDESAFLGVVDKDEVGQPEAHYPFYMTCSLTDAWTMVVSDIDAKQLGAAIAGDQPVAFDIGPDGPPPAGDVGGYVPFIAFNQMDAVWEYSASWDLGVLDELTNADVLRVRGTGVDRQLPTEGMKDAVAKFNAACSAIGGEDDSGVPPDTSQ